MAVTLYLSCDPGLRRVLVEPAGDGAETAAVLPLMRFLRLQPPWPGQSRLALRVNYPAGVAAAFRPATTVVSAEQLEDVAALVWYDVGGGSVLLEWQRQTRAQLTAELQRLAREHPELPFAR